MKRRALPGQLQEHGCVCRFAKVAAIPSGATPQTGRKEAIPRHNEIKKFLARSICKKTFSAASSGQLMADR